MANFAGAKNVEFIINFPNEKEAPREIDEKTSQGLKSLGLYYTNLHDEFSPSEGDEHIHRHLVISSPVNYSSSAWLLTIATLFDVPLPCVQIMAVKSLRKRIRYLCHLDDSDKFQFEADRVQTNDPKGWLKYQQEIPQKPTIDDLISYGGDWVSFGRDYGIELAHRYRRDIEDVEKFNIERKSEVMRIRAADNVLHGYRRALEDVTDALTLLETILPKAQPDSPLWTVKGYLERVLQNDFDKFETYGALLENGEVKK